MSRYVRLGLLLLVVAVVAAVAVPAMGRSSEVTRGDLATFAAGAGLDYEISGHAQMVRRSNGTTKVKVHIEGLDANEQYVSHVHDQACGEGDAGGHFQQDSMGASVPPNEIWPGGGPFSPTPAGVANVSATVDYAANDSAVSVVVHLVGETGKPKIACADLS